MAFKIEQKRRFVRVPDYVFFTGKLLTNTEFRVLMTIAFFEPSYPSYEKIMSMSGIGDRHTVARALKSLKDKGVLKISKTWTNGRKTNYYEITHGSQWMDVQFIDLTKNSKTDAKSSKGDDT